MQRDPIWYTVWLDVMQSDITSSPQIELGQLHVCIGEPDFYTDKYPINAVDCTVPM